MARWLIPTTSKEKLFLRLPHPWDSSGAVAAEVFDLWPTADRYKKTYKIAEGLISKGLLPKGSSVQKWASRLANEYTEQCENEIGSCAEIVGATQALNELSEKGFLLFVNSATPVEPLQKLLKLRNWDHYFQSIYGAEACKADNLKQIASKTGATRNEIVHVGDQYDDLQAAEEFGCHFVAMADGNNRPVAKASPLVVQKLSELPGLLIKLDQEAS